MMNTVLESLREIRRYPSAIFGALIIMLLFLISVITPIVMPYDEAIQLWRGSGNVWEENPRNAAPAWTNLFLREKKAETIKLDSRDAGIVVGRESVSAELDEKTFVYTFDYTYDLFPPELILFMDATYDEKQPFIDMAWFTPDGREIRIGDVTPKKEDTYRFSNDTRLQRRLGDMPAQIGLFADPDNPAVPLKGTYRLEATALLFEPNSDVEAKLVVYGDVHGIAGTDHLRRDLSVALLWGTPIAMSFGLLAALGTTLITMCIAAVGVWYGGIVDATIQRITEINSIIPLLPVLIMVGTFYSRSIWIMLGIVIGLSIFGLSIKNYRAIFLQVKELPYMEAAQAYGTSNSRLIFRYLIPRILPLVLPQLVILVPSFVFLEASLAFLGLGDPVLPTWGKIIQDAQAQGALFSGYYYWILEPAALLMLAGLAFAMVGFALDRIFNPRLREL